MDYIINFFMSWWPKIIRGVFTRHQTQVTISPATFLSRFVFLFFPLIVLFLIISLFVYLLESANHLKIIANKEKVVVGTGLQLIHDTINPIQADLGFLTELCGNNVFETLDVQRNLAAIERLEKIFFFLPKTNWL